MQSLLVPILKKSNIHVDPSITKNHRPVVISNTVAKLSEVQMLDVFGIYEFHHLQFGFISARRTTMAVVCL